MSDRGKEFADLLYTLLVVEKTPSIGEAARSLGMTYATLHSRVVARTCFSADEIRELIRMKPDPRLVSYLLDGTSFVAADRAVAGRSSHRALGDRQVQRGVTRVVVEAANVLDIVDASIAGGGLDHRREAIVLEKIADTERALASVRVGVESR